MCDLMLSRVSACVIHFIRTLQTAHGTTGACTSRPPYLTKWRLWRIKKWPTERVLLATCRGTTTQNRRTATTQQKSPNGLADVQEFARHCGSIVISCMIAFPDCTKCKNHRDGEMPSLHLYDESRRVSSDVRLEEERGRNSFGEGPTGHKRDAALAPQAGALESSTHDSLHLIHSRFHTQTESIIETQSQQRNHARAETYFCSCHPTTCLLIAELSPHSLLATL